MKEWLGMGAIPVDQEIAEERADICRTCPENVKGSGWIDRLKAEVAATIRDHLNVKNELELSVPEENEIGFCKQCGCVLTLKVWCPIEHILSHTSQSELKEFPDFCWQRTEGE